MPSSAKQSGPIWMPQAVGFSGASGYACFAVAAAGVARDVLAAGMAAAREAKGVAAASAARGVEVAVSAAAALRKLRLDWDMA